MRSSERLALAILLGLAVLVFGTAGAATYAWHRSGHLRLAVHEAGPNGSDVSLSLPGILVDAAITLCPMPAIDELDEHAQEILPVLREVSEHLAAMPDAVLVDVRDDDETVRIEKLDGELLIRVVSQEERVEIAVPLQSVQRLARKLGARATA